MKIVYFHTAKGNFGDELNRWLWPRIITRGLTGFTHHGNANTPIDDPSELWFYGIGTILDERIPPDVDKIIFGSGFGYGARPPDIARAKVFFVRGKYTARELNLTPDKALTDPAILLRRFFPLIPEHDRIHEISVIPHHSSVKGDFWRRACNELGLHYIDPRTADIQRLVEEISASKLVIAEAMHGAIVADAFRVPWIAISSVEETNDFKWRDWCESVGLDYKPTRFTAIYENTSGSALKNGINAIKLKVRERELSKVLKSRCLAQLSDEKLLDTHLRDMDQRLGDLQDYLQQRGVG